MQARCFLCQDSKDLLTNVFLKWGASAAKRRVVNHAEMVFDQLSKGFLALIFHINGEKQLVRRVHGGSGYSTRPPVEPTIRQLSSIKLSKLLFLIGPCPTAACASGVSRREPVSSWVGLPASWVADRAVAFLWASQ